MNGVIEKNIVNDCENGIKIKDDSNPEVCNNYIINCVNGIEISYDCNNQVIYNNIENCNIGLNIKWESTPFIEKNNIKSDICIRCERLYNNYFEVHYCNLDCIVYSFKVNPSSYQDILANNNYFFTNNSTIINESIYDKNDVGSEQEPYYCNINYIPFLTEEYSYAGIQN